MQWEDARGVGVKCALLFVGKRSETENIAVAVVVGRNHRCLGRIGMNSDMFYFDWLTVALFYIFPCTSYPWLRSLRSFFGGCRRWCQIPSNEFGIHQWDGTQLPVGDCFEERGRREIKGLVHELHLLLFVRQRI